MVGQRRGFFRIDGHRIAFATVGEGPLLVLPAWSVSNLVEDLKDERFRRFMNSLTSAKQVIRYDRLGSGLSDRRRPRERLSLDFEAANARHILDHAFDARRKGKPRILHIPRYEAAANRRASLRGIPTKPGLDRDESRRPCPTRAAGRTSATC